MALKETPRSDIFIASAGYSAAWLARLTGGQKVAGSNPVTPISQKWLFSYKKHPTFQVLVKAAKLKAQYALKSGHRGYGKDIGIAIDATGSFVAKIVGLLSERRHESEWGWGCDECSENLNVLYLSTHRGEIALRAPDRFARPEYPGVHGSFDCIAEAVIDFSQSVLNAD